MKERWLQYKNKWLALAPREKQMTGLGALIILILFVYGFLWSPLVSHVEAMRKKLMTERKLLAWMKENDGALQTIKDHSDRKNSNSTVGVLASLQRELQQKNLMSFVTQLKQESNEAVNIELQKVDFDSLMRFLMVFCHDYAVKIQHLSVQAERTPGTATARIVLKADKKV